MSQSFKNTPRFWGRSRVSSRPAVFPLFRGPSGLLRYNHNPTAGSANPIQTRKDAPKLRRFLFLFF